MIERSDEIAEIAKALLGAQKEIGVAVKGSENPYFKSSYADLQIVIESVKEPLNNNGVVFLQAVNISENGPQIVTTLLHESGQWVCSTTPVFCAKPNDPQAFGSGITYSKRYALQAILGLPTADDDGNAAAKKKAVGPIPEKKKAVLKMSEKAKKQMGVLYLKAQEVVESKMDGFNADKKRLMDWVLSKGKFPESDADRHILESELEAAVQEISIWDVDNTPSPLDKKKETAA